MADLIVCGSSIDLAKTGSARALRRLGKTGGLSLGVGIVYISLCGGWNRRHRENRRWRRKLVHAKFGGAV